MPCPDPPGKPAISAFLPWPSPSTTVQRLQGLGSERETEKEDGEGVQIHSPRHGDLLTLSFILTLT